VQKKYDTRTDLGNTVAKDGDGFLFRGRTGIQITGRANTRAFRDWCRKLMPGITLVVPDFEKTPDAMLTDPWEGLGPIWYWDTRGLNRYADQGDVEMITHKINGGLNGLDDRIHRLVRISLVLLGYAPDAIVTFQKWAGEKTDGIAGPRTRAALHIALVAMTAPAVQSEDVQVAPVVEKAEVEKPVVPEKVEEKSNRWNWITSILGGIGLGWLTGMDWQAIAKRP
jgi:putative chitinase